MTLHNLQQPGVPWDAANTAQKRGALGQLRVEVDELITIALVVRKRIGGNANVVKV